MLPVEWFLIEYLGRWMEKALAMLYGTAAALSQSWRFLALGLVPVLTDCQKAGQDWSVFSKWLFEGRAQGGRALRRKSTA